MRIALVSEGTYPFAAGGVSVWCDQLIRGLPEYAWEMVALTADGSERPLWELPENLTRLRQIPLWRPQPPVRGLGRRPGNDFRVAYAAFLRAMLAPEEPGSEQGQVHRSQFLLALRLLHEYAAEGGHLGGALISDMALTMTMDAWHGLRRHDGDLTLGDCVTALSLIEHMLRPLSAEPVRAEVVHSSMNGLSMLVGMAAKWRYGTPVVMSEHGMYLRERYLALPTEDWSHPVKVLVLCFHRLLAGAGYLIADALAPHSRYNRRWQLHNGADPGRMWTVYNGVAPDEFPTPESEPDEPVIVYLGRIDPLKDLHTLIRAFALVREQVPAARLRIYGEASAAGAKYRDSCLALIADLGLNGTATLDGRVDVPAEAYHQGQVVALTSITEGFPYTVVEAMACGRPIVGTNVGGVAEAVGEAGYVVPARDHAAVAQACVRLLQDAPLRARMGAEARARVLAHFTLAQSLHAYRRIYRDVADGRATLKAGTHVVRPASVRGRPYSIGPSTGGSPAVPTIVSGAV